MKNRILYILMPILIVVLFASCDSRTAAQFDGYWQCDESSSTIWKYERRGELGGINGDNDLWIVLFGNLRILTGSGMLNYPISVSGDKMEVEIDGKKYHFHRISETEASQGRNFAERIVGMASSNSYAEINKNTLKGNLGYSSKDFHTVSQNTYAVYFDDIDCGENIYLTSQIYKVNRRNNKIQVFSQNFNLKNGTSPKFVATLIKDMLEKKFGFSMHSGTLSEDVGTDQFDFPAYWYFDMGGGISYAIRYDDNYFKSLEFVVGFDAEATANFFNLQWGD